MSRQVQIFKQNLAVPLLLENVPDSPQDRTRFGHYPYFNSEQISRLILENDIGFLLDLTHAKITSRFRGWDVRTYLSELPLSRIAEIHVNGSGFDSDGFPADIHASMDEEDFDLLDWILGITNPEIITLEYSGLNTEQPEETEYHLFQNLKRLNEYRI